MRLIKLTIVVCLLSSCSDNEHTVSEPKSELESDTAYSLLTPLKPKSLGLNFIHDADFSDKFSIYEPLGSGVAILDVNNDGLMDLFVPQYGKNKSTSQLFLNEGDGFRDITKESGLDDIYQAIFASVADFNNDGRDDLLTGGYNHLSLRINQGNHQFKESKLIHAAGGTTFYTGASWFDIDRDGFLDLWLINYVDDLIEDHCKSSSGLRDYCPPKSYRFLNDRLLINDSGIEFKESDFPAYINRPLPGLGVVSDDFDNNGWQDIYIANDGEANQLYLNSDGKFSKDTATLRGAAFNMMGQAEASMGIAIGDIDDNHYPDIFITHFNGETNTLYLNKKGQFSDHTIQSGLNQYVKPLTGFGTLFSDINGDNSFDLIAANGSTQYTEKPQQSNGRLNGEVNQLWLSQSEGFKYFTLKEIKEKVSRGLVVTDFDNDGDFDIIISNNNQKLSLLRNELNPANWLGLSVKCHSRYDIGARVTLVKSGSQESEKYIRTVHRDGSYASSSDPRIIFYRLNDTDQVTVHWTHSKSTSSYAVKDLNRNQFNTLNCF